MPVANDGLGLGPTNEAAVLAGLLPADLPAALERFLRRFASVEGVMGIRRTFALGSALYASWFADRISNKVHGRS
jgi:hypothetical protein